MDNTHWFDLNIRRPYRTCGFQHVASYGGSSSNGLSLVLYYRVVIPGSHRQLDHPLWLPLTLPAFT